MEISFWQQRWQENQIGFHLSDVNPYLKKYWPLLQINSSVNVLVPLCGKTLDLSWLAAQDYNVLGVECSEQAILAFLDEQNINAEIFDSEHFRIYVSENIRLLNGDFFKLTSEMLAEVDVVYDRASLVALPESMRQQYVELLAENLPSKVRILLVTLEYDQSAMNGPPFSVTHSEVESLYSSNFNVDIIHEQDIIDEQPRFKDRGLEYMIERVYIISR